VPRNGDSMKIGEYVDGRDLTYDHQGTQFAVGGTPVALVQVLQYDAHSQILWSNAETRAWALELRNWMESPDVGTRSIGDEGSHVVDAVPAPPPSSIPPVYSALAASSPSPVGGAPLVSPAPAAASQPTSPNAKKMSPQAARWLWGSLAIVAVFVVVTVYTGVWSCGLVSVVLIVAVALSVTKESHRQSSETAMTCPHCQTRGSVRTKSIVQKKGISGGKATAAVLTGGVSMLATGLSRKEPGTEAHCSHCGATWRF
jgi:hypothetical protein